MILLLLMGVVPLYRVCYMNDHIFEALADETRRQLLFALLEHNPQSDSDVYGLPWEVSGSGEAVIERHHVHLPKLEDYGFIEWNREEKIVEKGPEYEAIEPYLETMVGEIGTTAGTTDFDE